MKAPHFRIGFLSLSLVTPCLSSRSPVSFVVVLPPDLFDDSCKFFYPKKINHRTITLSLSYIEVIEHKHNPLPNPLDFVLSTEKYAIREEESIVSCVPHFREYTKFVSSRPPRVLRAGVRKHKHKPSVRFNHRAR